MARKWPPRKHKLKKTCTSCGLSVWRQSEFVMVEKETGKLFRFHRICAEREYKKNPERWEWLNPWEVL